MLDTGRFTNIPVRRKPFITFFVAAGNFLRKIFQANDGIFAENGLIYFACLRLPNDQCDSLSQMVLIQHVFTSAKALKSTNYVCLLFRFKRRLWEDDHERNNSIRKASMNRRRLRGEVIYHVLPVFPDTLFII